MITFAGGNYKIPQQSSLYVICSLSGPVIVVLVPVPVVLTVPGID